MEGGGSHCVLFWILNDTNVLSFKIHLDFKRKEMNKDLCVQAWRNIQDSLLNENELLTRCLV